MSAVPFDAAAEAELAGLPWDGCRAEVEGAAERLGLSLDRVMAGVAERRAAFARARADGHGNGGAYGEVPPPEKRPLFRPLPPAPVFPAETLGPLRDAAEAIQMLTRAPLAMCAQAAIAAATLAAQAQRGVELPGGGRKPLSGMFVSVADSGERKTGVDKVALAPVHRVEARWREEAGAARARFQNELDAWKAAREAAKKRNKGNRADLRAAFDEIGPEPKPPPHPMLLMDDLTPEGLQRHLAEGRPWCGVFTAEGGLVVGGHGFNEETRMRTAALLNKLWDGEPIRKGRGMTGSAFLPGKRRNRRRPAWPWHRGLLLLTGAPAAAPDPSNPGCDRDAHAPSRVCFHFRRHPRETLNHLDKVQPRSRVGAHSKPPDPGAGDEQAPGLAGPVAGVPADELHAQGRSRSSSVQSLSPILIPMSAFWRSPRKGEAEVGALLVRDLVVARSGADAP